MNWLLNLLAANFRRNCLAVKGPNTIAGWWGNEGDGSGPDLAAFGKGRYLLNVAFFVAVCMWQVGVRFCEEAVAVVEGVDES